MIKKLLVRLRSNKTILYWVSLAGVIITTFVLWIILRPIHSPVPASIRQQANFTIIYPANDVIDSSSWRYVSSQASVTFTTRIKSISVAFTEQQTPLAFQNDLAAYNRFIGGLKPKANFNVSLGTVSLANFVTAGDYQVVGLTGILNAKGTFLLAHPSQNLTDNLWRELFSDLKTV